MLYRSYPTGLNYLLRSPTGVVGRDMLRRGTRVAEVAQRRVDVDTGNLRRSIHVEVRPGASGSLVVRVGTDVGYARFVHDGTGIYGPRGRPITPTHGRVLVFTPRGSNRAVFARSVRGRPPNPFLLEALPFALQ